LTKEKIFKGIPASPGISISKAYVYTKGQIKINLQKLNDNEINKEIEEFKNAIQISIKELTKVYNLSKERIGEENSKIFDAQLAILNDTVFFGQVIKRIEMEKRAASYIIHDEITKLDEILASGNDYMKDRVSDFNDVKNRIVRNMKREKLVSKVDENTIIFAHDLTPADTILFSKRKVMGYVTDTGGTTSHAAIISRALRVPAVVGMKAISKSITSGELVIIDGFDGIVISNPTEETLERYKKKLEEYNKSEKALSEITFLPCITLDDVHIDLSANAEFEEEIEFVAQKDRCGIGLFRTEHLFFEKGDFPSEVEQVEEYTQIANVAFPETVTIRTFDLGGDKILPASDKESNPFLGWRGIRISLVKTDIFKTQLRAILKASTKKNIKIMFPMISSIDEVKKSKIILDEVKEELRKKRITFDEEIQMGIMIEVPSAVMTADDLAKEVDFFSIGTNDLIQYLIALDRSNGMISEMFQEFHPAVLRSLKIVIDTAHKNNIRVSICGEMASIPLAAIVLVGLGIDELSVVPSIYPKIKQIIRKMRYSEAKILTDNILKLSTEKEIRDEVEKFYIHLFNQ
jgi:phosphoenolpyruvate-protein phosphotransferase (PTS system enzyme I)